MVKLQKATGLSFIAFTLLMTICVGVAYPQSTTKRPLTHNDYDSWKSISGSAISTDGNWILFIEAPQDGEAE